MWYIYSEPSANMMNDINGSENTKYLKLVLNDWQFCSRIGSKKSKEPFLVVHSFKVVQSVKSVVPKMEKTIDVFQDDIIR